MFIPAVKEAESRLRCTSDVNYKESIVDNNSLPLLSDREKDVLICVAKGMSNKEIAEQLNIKVPTVKVHYNQAIRMLRKYLLMLVIAICAFGELWK